MDYLGVFRPSASFLYLLIHKNTENWVEIQQSVATRGHHCNLGPCCIIVTHCKETSDITFFYV